MMSPFASVGRPAAIATTARIWATRLAGIPPNGRAAPVPARSRKMLSRIEVVRPSMRNPVDNVERCAKLGRNPPDGESAVPLQHSTLPRPASCADGGANDTHELVIWQVRCRPEERSGRRALVIAMPVARRAQLI